MNFTWIILEFHMNFLCTSHEALMNYVLIAYELLHDTFMCTSHVFQM